MAKMTYKEQLLHPSWQRKRLEMLDAAEWMCECCGGAETTLHVHHKRYIKGRMAWEYEDDQLEVLCAVCHAEQHANRDVLDRLLSESEYGTSTICMAVGLLAGFLNAKLVLDDDELVQAAISIDGNSYDCGVLAAIAAGAGWPKMAAAAGILLPATPTPVAVSVIERWRAGS